MLGRPGSRNVNGRINSSSPNALAISMAQDVLINSGFQMNTRPLHIQIQGMAIPVLDAFQVTLSPEKKDFSLIRKQTSELGLGNEMLIDPAVEKSKPGLATAKQLGMPMEPANTIFEQDSPLTLNQQIQFTSWNAINRGDPDLSIIAARFCTTQFSVSGKNNKYFQNCQNKTRVVFSGKGHTIRGKSSYRSPDTRPNKRKVMIAHGPPEYQILPDSIPILPENPSPTYRTSRRTNKKRNY